MAYANGWFFDTTTPTEYARRAQEVVDTGYRALKFYPFRGAQLITKEEHDEATALVAAVREQVGDGYLIFLYDERNKIGIMKE